MVPATLGRYEVLGEIAAGGMAEILLGRLVGPSGFERPVVIKRILRHLAKRDEFVAMFLDEARIVAGIRHHNVVHVHELSREGEDLFLVMEYLEGESLGGLVKRLAARGDRLAPALAAHIVAEACAGLHAAHELANVDGVRQDLVHRDISPSNIFVTYDGQVKVLDFGVAIAADRITRTEAGQLKGKYEYMSPEQVRGEPLDRRSDLFALGVVLYEATTGRRLFKRPTPAETFRAITDYAVVPPSRVCAAYPPVLEPICLRALEQARDARHPSALELRRELVGAVRELGAEDPAAQIAAQMRALFADRIGEKQELLRRMRSGSEVSHVPQAELDTPGDLPDIPIELATSLEIPRALPRTRARLVLPAIALAVVVAGSMVFLRRREPPVLAAPAEALPVPSVTSAPSPPSGLAAITEVTVQLDTRPTGATVLLDGVARGATPLALRLPRGSAPLSLELRRSGFARLQQSIVPDLDQKLLLTLHPEPIRVVKPAAAAPTPTTTQSPWKKWH